MTHSDIASFISSVADLIRDTLKRGKYQDLLLPLTVLRRIDQVLKPTKEKVLKTYSEIKRKLDNPDDLLRKLPATPSTTRRSTRSSGWWTTSRTSPKTSSQTPTRSARTCGR